ncbi:MAG: HU family DNA-binding protein [Candidatus Contendobacter sp.]|nr:HU family DNA-binding protein [Candidatus Contendobacter sp.]MDG4556162.1 HU family DNA-binding protein [Candidatus Contendobacter sp.]
MPAEAPSNIIPSVKKLKDPLTNLQTACEFTARLSFDANKLKIAHRVDDLSDNPPTEAYTPSTFEVLSNFPPMIRILGVNVPRDGYSHPVIFKFWHEDAVEGDSDAVESDPVVAVFDEEPPPVPTLVSATVVRNRSGVVPDQVEVAWTSPHDVSITLLDDQGKKRVVGSGAEADSSLLIENCSRFGTQDGQSHAFRFGVQAVNRSASSAIVYANPVNLTTTDNAAVVQTPDDIAGTAQYLSYAQFSTWLATQFPTLDTGIAVSVLASALDKIKDIVAKGGSVMLSDVGMFKAQWTPERTAFRNGQYVTIPPVRNAEFTLSLGFQKGTKLGQVMTDTEAALV